MRLTALSLLGALFFLPSCASLSPNASREVAAESGGPWITHSGIETATFDGSLIVVRADPLVTPVALINPPASSGNIARIAAREGFAVATNAAMFAKDYVTSIGYMKNFEQVNNPRISANLKGFLLFNPKGTSSPAAKIGTKDDLDAYHTAFQSHRMWSAEDGILWKKGASIYRQVALVGVDGRGRILFFFHPSSTDVHEMVARILELKLDLKGLLYLDGGFHGALFRSPELGGGWNNWINLPNVLGIRPTQE